MKTTKRTGLTAALIVAVATVGLAACMPGPGGSNHPPPCLPCHDAPGGPTPTTVGDTG
jgi:hypothetical protein